MEPTGHYQHGEELSESDPWRPGRYCGPHCDLYQPVDEEERAQLLQLRKDQDVRAAQAYRAEGKSLFEIASRLGRSKEWLREYAGLR